METLLYLAKLALALVLGMGSAHLLGKERFTHVSAYAQMLLVWLLLFFMGVNTGGIDGITSQFGTIGITALLITLFGVAGTILVALFFSFILTPSLRSEHIAIAKRKEQSFIRRLYDIIKEPLLLVSIVILGLVLRLGTNAFSWFDSSLVTYLLYVLLFSVGMGMVHRKISFKGVFADRSLFFLPLYTILGTYVGAFGVFLWVVLSLRYPDHRSGVSGSWFHLIPVQSAERELLIFPYSSVWKVGKEVLLSCSLHCRCDQYGCDLGLAFLSLWNAYHGRFDLPWCDHELGCSASHSSLFLTLCPELGNDGKRVLFQKSKVDDWWTIEEVFDC